MKQEWGEKVICLQLQQDVSEKRVEAHGTLETDVVSCALARFIQVAFLTVER